MKNAQPKHQDTTAAKSPRLQFKFKLRPPEMTTSEAVRDYLFPYYAPPNTGGDFGLQIITETLAMAGMKPDEDGRFQREEFLQEYSKHKDSVMRKIGRDAAAKIKFYDAKSRELFRKRPDIAEAWRRHERTGEPFHHPDTDKILRKRIRAACARLAQGGLK